MVTSLPVAFRIEDHFEKKENELVGMKNPGATLWWRTGKKLENVPNTFQRTREKNL